MQILSSKTEDIDLIHKLYRYAANFQKTKGTVIWTDFDRSLIQQEIYKKRQWKIVIDNKIASIWTITHSDPKIWGNKNSDPAIYIHRIATNPEFRGQNLVVEIVRWARKYATKNEKKFIRMDTVGENTGLIEYYKKCGFDFLGLSKLENTYGLPAHYNNATVCLFQMAVTN